MSCVSAFPPENVTRRAVFLALAGMALAWTPAQGLAQPRPAVDLQLRDGRYLHLLPLPFGQLRGVVVGAARFDAAGTRAVLIATFAGAGVNGDWRTASPTQAFLVDAGRRALTQLSTDGRATSVVWSGPTTVRVSDGGQHQTIDVGSASDVGAPFARIASDSAVSSGSFVSPKATDRLSVWRRSDGRYAISQVGARALRIEGVAANGAFAIIGAFAAWIDGQRKPGRLFDRLGPDNAAPLNFSGSPYGDALVPILPLGSPVYQGAYRNGMAYFAFSYGVERIVAATPDFVNFIFPVLPHEPIFTVGDGLGAGSDGRLYFFRPEEDQSLFWRGGSYHRYAMSIPDEARDMAPLARAMAGIVKGETLWPPLRPSEDALDAAMLEWRFYPVGPLTGTRWLASHLGRLLAGDASGNFSVVESPLFPFAVLGRSDDGRVWGAAPLDRQAAGPLIADSHSALWWTRDGRSWHHEATFAGDVGAVAVVDGAEWAAFTRSSLGRAMIFVARLSADGSPEAHATGATYGGEQLFFAPVATGLFLVCGATPGRRLAGEGGTLVAYRLDLAALSISDVLGANMFLRDRSLPRRDVSLPAERYAVSDASAILEPTLHLASALGPGQWLTVRTDVAPDVDVPGNAIIMSMDQERAYELKYAGRPYPLVTVTTTPEGDDLVVTRTIEYGVLKGKGSVELWTRAGTGAWHRTSVRSSFSY